MMKMGFVRASEKIRLAFLKYSMIMETEEKFDKEKLEKDLELIKEKSNLCLRCKNARNRNFKTGDFSCTCKRKCENYRYFQLDKSVVIFIPNK